MYVKTNLRYYHKFGQIHTNKTAAWFHQWIFLMTGLGPLWGGGRAFVEEKTSKRTSF